MSPYLIDHLETAQKLAEQEGDHFVAYMIKMARDAAEKRLPDAKPLARRATRSYQTSVGDRGLGQAGD